MKERLRNRRKMIDYLSRRGCAMCGETDVVVLEFHHAKPDKQYHISEMVSKGYPWQSILRELRKCEILCANDHRRVTAKQRGWYRMIHP